MVTQADISAGEDHEFVAQPVPPAARRGFVPVFAAFLGFVIVAGQMVVGGGLAGQLRRDELLLAVIGGNTIAGIFAAIAGYTGAQRGVAFSHMLAEAFPGVSFRIASLYVPVVLVGWYSVEAGIFGNILGGALGVSDLAGRLLMLACGIAMAISAYFGFRWLVWVSFIALPAIAILGSYAIFLAATGEQATFGFSGQPIGLSEATGVVVGCWIMGAVTCVPDMTRFSRSAISGALVGFLGIAVGNSFNQLLGASGAAVARQADPALILLGLGLVVPGLLFGLANIWTTNDSNMYSASLHVAPLLGIDRRRAVLACAAVGAAVATFKTYELGKLFTFLGFLGATAPALGAVTIGRYWLAQARLIPPRGRPYTSWLAWAGGAAAAMALPGALSALVGVLVGIALLTLAERLPVGPTKRPA
ncbi:MAG: cytosine permease [Gemmatimonadales bacterium]